MGPGIWLRFFDDRRALPPPYNLFNFLPILKTFIIDKVFRRNSKTVQGRILDSVSSTQQGSEGVELTKELLRRYASDHFDTTYVRKQQPQSTGEILKDSLEEEEEENED